jgi:glutaredoxin
MDEGPRVVLYARRDCHLCDEARAGLEALRADGLDFDLEEVDIESDDELHSRFLERIPVIELEGEILCELWLDADAVRASLGKLSG